MTRLLVVIPTTAGPAILRRLAPRAGLPVSAAFADGDYRPLPWSADYAKLTAPGGPLSRALGTGDELRYELRLDRSFDAGRSWEAPVAAAHLLLADGNFDLTDDPASADVVLWATGAVDLDLGLIPGDYAVADKLALSRPLFEAASGAEIVVALPPGAAPEVDAALDGLPRLRIVRQASADAVAAELRRPARSPAETAEIAKGSAGRRLVAPAIVGAALTLAAVAFVTFRPAPSTPPATDPAPPPRAAGAPGPQPPAPVVALDELRAPAGRTCAQVLFGSAVAERRAVPLAGPDAFEPSRLDASLCGIALRPVDAARAALTVSGALGAASTPPRSAPGGGLAYMLKAGVAQKIVYQVHVQMKDGSGSPVVLRHEIAP